MKMFMVTALALSALLATSSSSASTDFTGRLQELATEAVTQKFPGESNLSGTLVCTSKDQGTQLECIYELGIYRCDDGGIATRWVNLQIDIRNSAAPVIQIGDTVLGGCN